MKPTQFIEVFRTNVTDLDLSMTILLCLASMFEGAQITFDLEDVDNVLRIASSSSIDTKAVISVVSRFGFQAEVMPEHEIYDL